MNVLTALLQATVDVFPGTWILVGVTKMVFALLLVLSQHFNGDRDLGGTIATR